MFIHALGRLNNKCIFERFIVVGISLRRSGNKKEIGFQCVETNLFGVRLINLIERVKIDMKSLEKAIKELIETLKETDPRIERWASVPSVGQVTVSMLLCEMPEIGLLSRGADSQTGRLGAVCQSIRESRTRPRTARGGRSKVRKVSVHGSAIGMSSTTHRSRRSMSGW